MSRDRLFNPTASSSHESYGSTSGATSFQQNQDNLRQAYKKSVHAIFSAAFNHLTYIFPTCLYNPQLANTFIETHELDQLAFRFMEARMVFPDFKTELLKALPQALNDKHLSATNGMTKMGFKLQQSKYYDTIAETIETLLKAKLEKLAVSDESNTI